MQDKFLDELSGGQRQRAFIAMVIAQDTEYILLDEPLNNLDMKHSVQIMKILRRLVDEMGKTVLIVLHDINFASVYSDRIVALKDGKLVKVGPTHEVIKTESLREIYDMHIPVQVQDGCRICVYFNSHAYRGKIPHRSSQKIVLTNDLFCTIMRIVIRINDNHSH